LSLHDAASDNTRMAKRFALRARWAVLVFLAAFPFAASAQSASDPAQGWKLSVAAGPAFALGKAAERWAKLVTERSGGKLPVRVYRGPRFRRATLRANSWRCATALPISPSDRRFTGRRRSSI